ncbi:formate dehydrogenase accessory sulfurtransferase FdhD [Thermohalobacter berrensis]|uniref:formate dehydrogenase accessory sulfurtransferase FdhD n=1 Tax=Thermohalobacter berrensis TaxID=99594 RepID=UPI001600DFE1|nr:formate dehydrogenase accessory sulfurtransferase FdhD [Thermohalobacter berrensis]
MKETKEYEILRIKGDSIKREEDLVIKEYPFTIYLNGEELVTLLCTPKSLKYLVIGFLQSEGLIDIKEDLKDIKIDYEKGIGYVYTKRKDQLALKLYNKRTITSGCGKGTIFYNVIDSFKAKKINKIPKIKKKEIFGLTEKFNKKSQLFLNTGGVHSCALCSKDKIIFFEEDIGRHNALDKVLGRALLEEIDLEDKIILTSGRVSSEILIKVLKRGIPILISRSAPTSLSIDIARKLNILLIGFARREKMNIYSNFPSINF